MCASLVNIGSDVKTKFNVATELRDNTDRFCTGPSYSTFLKKLVPIFRKLLEGPPVFMSTSWEHVRIASTLLWTARANRD